MTSDPAPNLLKPAEGGRGVRAGIGGRWGHMAVLVVMALILGRDPVSGGPKREAEITSIGGFWASTPDARAAGQPFRIEADVLYYDPAWKVLQIQDAGAVVYVHPDSPMAIRSGQRVVFTGTTQAPGVEFRFRDVETEVIGLATTQPKLVNLADVDHAAMLDHLVEIVGVIDSQGFDGEDHWMLTLVVDGYRVRVWVLVDPREPVPYWQDGVVRLWGVYAPRIGAGGRLDEINLFCPGVSAVEYLGRWATAPRFDHPTLDNDQLPTGEPGQDVRVQGTLVGAAQSGTLRVRDATGEVSINTAQVDTLPPVGSEVVVVGALAWDGQLVRLERAWVRPLGGTEAARLEDQAKMRMLRVTASVLELTPAEAKLRNLVRLGGLVTWSNPRSRSFFVNDPSGGVCVLLPDGNESPPEVGRHVAVFGTTDQGEFAPLVRADQITDLGAESLPRPKGITLEQAQTGVEEAQWVEVTGLVRRVKRDRSWAKLELSTATGLFTVRMPTDAALVELTGAIVTVQGVCVAEADDRQKLTQVEVWVADRSFVTVEDSDPTDWATIPERSLTELGRFNSAANLRRRVRVRATLLLEADGRLYLEADGEVLGAHARQSTAVRRGDHLEVIGFYGHTEGRPILRDAQFRVLTAGAEPPVEGIDDVGELRRELDGRLVAVRGRVLERFNSADGARLALQDGRTVFQVNGTEAKSGRVAALPEPGSLVEVNGIYDLQLTEGGRALGFRILTDAASSIRVLETPHWWTTERIAAAAGVLVVGMLGALLWVRLLQRQVQAQTAQIEAQMRRSSQLESDLLRASRLESLGTLAGGIAHDFNNLLTVMLGNVSLVSATEPLSIEAKGQLEAARQSAFRARDLAHQLITFSKGGAPVRTAVDMEALLRTEVQALDLPLSVVIQWGVDEGIGHASADEQQMRQVVQNLLLNALQAMPRGGTIGIGLTTEQIVEGREFLIEPGAYLRVSIRDSGEGIAAQNLNRVYDPYYTTRPRAHGLGLAVVYSIMRRHAGRTTIESTPMVGTEVTLWLPTFRSASPVV